MIVCESEPQLVKLPEEELVKVDMEIKQIVEAILFAANRPMTIRQLRQVFPELERPEAEEIQKAVDAIIEDYSSRSVELKLVASGYRFQVKEVMAPWVARLFEEKPPKYSRALLETLAIIAYRQPVTRGDIEDIRGVSVSSTLMRTLLDREWVRVVGHKEIPGRPALYSTTKLFLDYFDLSSLNELPTLQEIEDLESSVVPSSENNPVQEDDENQEATNTAVNVTKHPETTTTLQ